jgi:alpha-tubulin suppressor-like RCC1 family protein
MGYNSHGQLGDNSQTDRNQPVQILSSGVAKVSAGKHHSLVLKTDGSLWAMGRNQVGQAPVVGGGTMATIPTEVYGSPTSVTDIAAGDHHSLFISTYSPQFAGSTYGPTADLYAMGLHAMGQLGVGGALTHRSYPTWVNLSSGSYGVWQIACGVESSRLIKTDGALYGMGRNQWGQIGTAHQTNVDSLYPHGTGQAVMPALPIIQTAMGNMHSAFLH